MQGKQKPDMPNRIAVLDMGGQYIDLVKKAVQRQGFPADVLPSNTPLTQLHGKYGAIIISGSPANSSGDKELPYPEAAVLEQDDLAILGICYGMQVLARHFGGSIKKGAIREDGRHTTTVETSHPLFKGSKSSQTALFTHGDFVVSVPPRFKVIGQHKLPGESSDVAISAIARKNKVGVQFHPEVFDDTPEGYEMFKRFLTTMAGLKSDKSFMRQELLSFIKNARSNIKEHIGAQHVIAFVSGGVDSVVALALAAPAIDQPKLHAFYIDNGLMRSEDDAVIETLAAAGINIVKHDASALFLDALNGITDPQEKRHIIGRLFIEVQNSLVQKLKLDDAVLLQGTNAADRIESGHSKGSQHTEVIKTHHNQVKEVQDLKARGMLLEPLDDLFKDEIRALGRELGLPSDIVQRHPFPGPGLGIRIICSDAHQDVPAGLKDEIDSFLDSHDYNCKTAVLPVHSVGVGGDERSYTSAIVLQGQDSWESVGKLASQLPAHFRGKLNRVLVALGPAPIDSPRAIKTSINNETLSVLRAADKIVFEEMRKHNVLDKIKQCPVALFPLSFNTEGDKRTIVLRPVTTSTFMTVQAMLPERDLPEAFFLDCTSRILKEIPSISQVMLDATNKPPATTEFE